MEFLLVIGLILGFVFLKGAFATPEKQSAFNDEEKMIWQVRIDWIERAQTNNVAQSRDPEFIRNWLEISDRQHGITSDPDAVNAFIKHYGR